MADSKTPAGRNETDGVSAPNSPAARPATIGRLALLVAAAIAVVAVGTAIYRGQAGSDTGAAPATTMASEPAPTVDEVITGLEKKLQDDPDNAEGWRMLGWSYFETGRYAESATAMRRATKLDASNPEYFSMLGEALVMASDKPDIPADARQAFAQALALDPKDARARYFLAAAKDIDGQHQQAIDDWFALLAETPADAPYAEDVRTVIRNVGKERGIDVEKRLAKAKFAPPAGPAARTDGVDVATAAIPGPDRSQMQAAGALPQGQQEAMIRGMVDGLAAKLAANPDNADGWIMLMRSHVQLGELGKAQQAYKDAQTAFRNNGKESRRIKEAAAALGVPGA